MNDRNKKQNPSWLYCFKSDDGAVFLDMKDKVIKPFANYDSAIEFANTNFNLIYRNNEVDKKEE